ncbi:MAG: prolyl oligopeptidase family serine peptidase [Bryobacteraceae bacterium]
MRIASFLLLTALSLCAQPSLEQFLSAPFSQDLTVQGNRVAWVVTDRGVRNVWTAEGPAWKGRQLTHFKDDDGQEIGQLAMTPAGVVYTRGGDIETFRDIPNPKSLAVGPEQAVWFVPFAGGDPKKLAEGASPAVSPKGDRVLFSKAGQVYATNLDGAKPELVLYTKVRAGGLKFSPDGTQVAFVSSRGDHGFIGVYTFASKAVTYLDPSVDRDDSPEWSPDGKQVAFVRQSAETRAFTFGPVREAEPWSIRVANAASGSGAEIWRADPGKGSAFSPAVGESLVWTNGGSIIFPWEKTGWRHLYAVAVATKLPAKELTPGAFEVEHVAPMSNGGGVLYSSNQGDIDRRHTWSVTPAGDPRPLTAGAGIEWAPVQAEDGTIVVLRSTAKQPGHPAVAATSGMSNIVTPSYPAESALQEPKQVLFPSADGLTIHGQLFLPAGYQAGKKYPAIAFYHGGSRRQMVLGFHYMYYYANTYAMNQYLASKGYLVLSVNYRSGIGYGMEFREAINYGATGASEYQDVQGAGVYLKGREDVDGKRIGVYGGSYGGYLTAMALSRSSDLYAAGVDIHGVHDWNTTIRNFVPAYNPQAQQDAARLAFESSPLASVKTWKSPVLLIHGDDDRNVNFSETVRLVEALRKQHIEPEQLIFPDEVHDFLTFGRWLDAMKAADGFFGRKLK